jgi:hypothetical protein
VEARRQSESEFRVILARQSAEITDLVGRLQALSSGTAPDEAAQPESAPEPPPEPEVATQLYRVPEPPTRPWWKFW